VKVWRLLAAAIASVEYFKSIGWREKKEAKEL